MVTVLAVLFAGCSSSAGRSVNAERPVPSLPGIDRFQEIVVAGFAEVEAIPDLAYGRKLAEYLEAELQGSFKGKVSRRPMPLEPGAALLDRAVWKSAGSGLASAVFLTGTADLTQDAQKALKPSDLPKDGPFQLESHGLVERTRFVLTVDVALVDAATGDTIWKTQIKETRTYPGIQETADFALGNLLAAVKRRLLPILFGR
jgi:hypothetical protein